MPRALLLTSSTIPTAASETAKAEPEITSELPPARMAQHAPNAAPCDAPRKSGETSGFWKIPWKAAPAAERLAPTRITSRMRGRRTLKKSVSCCAEKSPMAGATREARSSSASAGPMG